MQKQLEGNYGCELFILAKEHYRMRDPRTDTSVRIQPPLSTPGFQADHSFHRFSWLNTDNSTAK